MSRPYQPLAERIGPRKWIAYAGPRIVRNARGARRYFRTRELALEAARRARRYMIALAFGRGCRRAGEAALLLAALPVELRLELAEQPLAPSALARTASMPGAAAMGSALSVARDIAEAQGFIDQTTAYRLLDAVWNADRIRMRGPRARRTSR